MQKVAAYCRVSTDKEDQINSLGSQKKYFREYINRNPVWDLTEIYVDEGITGTSTKKRRAFNKMITDASSHKFDLIITKEISRFARNTLDSIYYTRKLKELGIGVIFMNDNINTLDSDAELRLTIMSSIAQEESRKTSERVKWGQKRRMEEGIVFGRDMVGYDVRDGKLHINEKGAEIIRIIFHKFTNEGKGTHVIARELQEACIPTANHQTEWSNVVILRILRNEKYVGDLIQKKTYTPNYLNHEKKYNHGEEDFVILRNHHEPIITRELFDRTQRELERRSPSKEQKAKHSNRYCFSGKIKCGVCGCSFVSRYRKRQDGSVYKTWRCYEATNQRLKHIDSEGNELRCEGHSLKEEDLKFLLQQLVKDIGINKLNIINNLSRTIKSIISLNEHGDCTKNLQNRITLLANKKLGLIELYLSEEISKPNFIIMYQKYDNDIKVIEKELQEQILKQEQVIEQQQIGLREEINQQQKHHNSQDKLLLDIMTTIKDLVNGETWEDIFYRNLLDKIVVFDRNHMDVYLNSLPCKFRCISK